MTHSLKALGGKSVDEPALGAQFYRVGYRGFDARSDATPQVVEDFATVHFTIGTQSIGFDLI
jgi:hypothetical protein